VATPTFYLVPATLFYQEKLQRKNMTGTVKSIFYDKYYIDRNYILEFYTIPANLPVNHEGRAGWLDDRAIYASNTHGSICIRVFTAKEDECVAQAIFAATAEGVLCDDIFLRPKHRWQGIAKGISDIVEATFDVKCDRDAIAKSVGDGIWRAA
jgi:GNAT superfamily N-acetyltransferase